MKKVKLIVRRAQFYFMARPALLIALVALFFFSLLSFFEVFRAKLYMSLVSDYKNSILVSDVKDKVENLNEVAGNRDSAVFCQIDFSKIINNSSLSNLASTKELMEELSEQVSLIDPPPAFSSFAEFMPDVKDARKTSISLKSTVQELKSASKLSDKSVYCTNLEAVLAKIYFLPIIRSPQGISGLAVGQLENFQVNVTQAQSLINAAAPPSEFGEEHLAIKSVLNQTAINLREEDNNAIEFSRLIEQQLELLNSTLDVISNKSSDLEEIPARMSITVEGLK